MQFSSTSWQKPDIMCRLGAIQIMCRLHISRLAGLIKWMAMVWAFGFISIINEFFSLASLLTEVNFSTRWPLCVLSIANKMALERVLHVRWFPMSLLWFPLSLFYQCPVLIFHSSAILNLN